MKRFWGVRDNSHSMFSQSLRGMKAFLLTGVLLVFLIALLAHSVLSQFANALIGRDSSFSVWSLWFPGHALWLNQDLIITDYAVFPFKQNLLLAISPLGSVLFALLRSVNLNVPIAFNLLYLAGFVFTGWAMLAYLTYLRVPRPLAIFCALLLTFSPIMHYRLLQGRPDLTILGWIPLGCLIWSQVYSGHKGGLRLAGVLLGAVFTSLQVAILAMIIWIPYFAANIWGAKPGDRRRLIDYLLLQVLVGLAVCMIYPLPGLLKTLVGLAPSVTAISLLTIEWQVSLGFLLMLLLWAGLLGISIATKGRASRFVWIGVGLVCLAASGVMGLGWADARQTILSPIDWFVPASIALCVFIALSLTPVWERWWSQNWQKKRILVIPVLLLVGAIAFQQSPPMTPWLSTSAYAAIAKEPGDYAILEIPFGLRSLTDGQSFGNGAELQQYAAVHHKRTLSGSLTEPEKTAIATYSASPLFRFLAGESSVSNKAISAELQAAVERQQIGYLVMHLNHLRADQQPPILNFLDTQVPSLCKVFADSSAIVYRTSWHPFGCSMRLE